jgi:PBSX family phage terminase large subunit
MSCLISKITLNNNGQERVISFEKDGKWNLPQVEYFNALFNTDLSLKCEYDELAYFGAFRCGKSFSQQLAVYLICSKYNKVRCTYVRDTYDELESSVIEQFNQDFQQFGNYTYLKSNRTATFKGTDSIIYFRAFNYDTDILSSERDLIAACQVEDIPEELFLQFFGRLSGKALTRPLLLTEGNPASNYVKRRYKDVSIQELQEKRIFYTQGRTQDNPHITPEYIERIRANYPAFWIARYLDSEWTNLDELVFSEYRELNNLIEPIDPKKAESFKRRISLDYGWINPTAILWGYVDYDGVLTIYDEWFGVKTIPVDIARNANKHGKILCVADYSIKSAGDDGVSTWQKLQDAGMSLVESNKDELANIVLVNTLLKTGRIKITKNCVNLIHEMINYKWKKRKLGQDKNAPEETVDKDNHGCDALLYMVADLDELKTEHPYVQEFKQTIAHQVFKQNQDVALGNLS